MRLAYEQGLLQGKSLNSFQRWALKYHMSYKRWFLSEVEESVLKGLVFAFKPERFAEMFTKPEVESEPISPDEFDSIERYLQEQDKIQHTMSGSDYEQLEDEGWI